ncbi:conserved hypothetical protein [Candidatus Desulfarcum epimagneticum]|uniref:Tetratricopeptide repeat protein n=1 Tax=uncultured Desulfobacteraceae bacterium TaxID=218296 RepID=A0A484HDP0_9BACT|nr:conserved hypothetical protein [uncultured Desulfobacteraceae bacterium]
MTDKQRGGAGKECVACREEIRGAAVICRHCGSSQKNDIWEKTATALKWLGGVVTVISLLAGMVTLMGYYRDWRERRDAVAELLYAADWLARTRNYSRAWQMNEKALGLVPGSAEAFDGRLRLAKLWLRDFRVNKKDADGVLNDVTDVLFRGLRGAGKNESAEILAHIGWAQATRVKNYMPTVIDVDAVFEEALRANPENVYANAMLGHWILMRLGASVKNIDSARSKFAIAVKNPDKRAFARELQFSGLIRHSQGRDDEVERAALGALLQESFSMMKNSEPKPAESFRRKILDAYGTMGRAEHVEAAVALMPPADHLAAHAWLMDGLDYSRPRALAQAKYLRARLTEELGEKEKALGLYQSLLKESKAAKELNGRVDQAIARLSGKLPERALARSYLNDPMGKKDPWRFHMDTLSHFDPRWTPANFDQAIDYFENALSRPLKALPDPKLSELIQSLPAKLDRIRKVVRQGDKIQRLNAYTSDFSVGHHENARLNLLRLGHIHVRALTAGGKLDKAIAQLGDMKKAVDSLNERWTEMRAWIAFEFARAYAIRAGLSKSDADAANALKYLKMALYSDGFSDEIATWDEIKGDVFKSLRDDPAYRELIRGR